MALKAWDAVKAWVAARAWDADAGWDVEEEEAWDEGGVGAEAHDAVAIRHVIDCRPMRDPRRAARLNRTCVLGVYEPAGRR